MEKRLCVILFRTEKNEYIFDGVTSEIIPVSPLEKDIITNYYKNSKNEIWIACEKLGIKKEQFETKYKFISELIERGMFYLGAEESEKLDEKLEDYIYKVQNMSLLLVLTERCNFRCEYCVYSDKYPHEMAYSQEDMNFETAKKAIEEYVQLFKTRIKRGFAKRPSVLFYGGEPLIKVELIKCIVDYIKEIKFDCDFYLTTNGLLLNEKNAEYFVKNNFNITFSLDGYQENHDRNRVTVSGEPTFEKVFSNLLRYQEIKRKNHKNNLTTFNCCYDNYTDLKKCFGFFQKYKDELEPIYVGYSMISPYDTLYYKWVEEHLQGNNRYSPDTFANSYHEIQKSFINGDYNDIYEKSIVQNLFIGAFAMSVRGKWNKQKFNNCCIPLSKIAVYPDGTYTLCEKMNKKLKIGTVDKGIDYKKVSEFSNKLINNFEKGKCSTCPAKRICNVCFQFMDEKGKISEEFCKREFVAAQKRLSDFCSMYEKNPEFLSHFKSMEEESGVLELLG